MMGRTHVVAGVAAALAISAATDTLSTMPPAAYALAGFCALLPDLDQPRSLAGRYRATKPIKLALKRFRHRRFTHSFAGIAVFTILLVGVWALLAKLGIALSTAFILTGVTGYVSHLVADAFNKQGIQLFWPLCPFGIEWWSMPIPKPLRISTITERSGTPLTPSALQARIHTEKWFFRYPLYLLIGYLVWANLGDLIASVTRLPFV